MRALRALAAAAGFAALAVAAALVLGALSAVDVAAVADPLSDVDAERYLLALAAVLLAGSAWFVRRRSDGEPDRFDALREAPPEGVAAPAAIRVGGRFDRLVADAVAAERDGDADAVVDRLRDTAVGLYGDVTGVDRAVARRRVESGEWTDDPLAAAFLSPATTMPLPARVRAWLDPERERRRRVDAAIAALFDLRDGSVPDATAESGPEDGAGDEPTRPRASRAADGGGANR